MFRARAAYVAVTVGDPQGNGVVYFIAQGSPIPQGVAESVLEDLVARGLVEVIDEGPVAELVADSEPEVQESGVADFSSMNVAELRSFADAHGIDLDGATRKDDIRGIVEAAVADADRF